MTAAAILAPLVMSRLYRIIFENGKSYIGITSRTTDERFAEHLACARAVGKYQSAVHRAILKYGADSVKVETLAVGDWEYIKALEVRAIVRYNTRPPFGYNLTQGGDGVVGFDESTRARMGAANIGRKPSPETLLKLSAASTGRKHDAETKKRMSSGRMGMKFSEEHRKSLSAARQKVVALGGDHLTDAGRARLSEASRAARLGIPRSAETKAKLSAANMGKKASEETKAKQSAALKGRPRPSEVMERIVATRMANKLAKQEAGIVDERQSHWIGRRHSQEALEKMSAAHKGRVLRQSIASKRAAIKDAERFTMLDIK